MPTPQSVIDAEAAADELIAKLAKDGATPEPGAGDEPPVTPDPSQAAEPDPEPEPPAAEPEGGDQTVPPVVDDGKDDNLSAQLAELQEKFDKLEAAHSTLRGKTYAEVPRLVNEVKEWKDKCEALEAKLDSKTPEPSLSAGDVQGKASEILNSIKEDVNEDVADRIMQLIETVISQRVESSIQPVVGRVEDLNRTALERSQAQYMKDLTDLVPDWRDITADPEYSAMLSETDELSGVSMYELAVAARDRLDAPRQAAFFNKFKKLKGIALPGEKPAAPEPKKAVSGKDALVSPKGSAKTGDRSGIGEEKPDYITTRQMEEFNAKRRAGKVTSKEEIAWEARVDKAITKGWIVP